MSIDITTQVSNNIVALEREFNAITHNMANVNTVGYKRIVNSFTKSLAQQDLSGDDETSLADLAPAIDFSQGLSLQQTGRSLDVAMYGKGFFVVETADGPLYTRNGSLQINQNGQMVDSQGRIVSGEGGPITVPGDIAVSQIHIGGDGSVGAADRKLGQIKMVSFSDEKKLEPAGDNCFKAPQSLTAVNAENVTVRQGYLESSNVNIVEELVDMIMVSRLYESNMKFMAARKEAGESLMSVAMG